MAWLRQRAFSLTGPADYCVDLLLVVLVLGKRTLSPATETGLTLVKSLNFQCCVQELRESRGGRPGLSVLTSLLVSVDVKLY